MKISILCVGKIKERYFSDGIAEYAKRLSRYCKLDIIEVPDEKTPDGASERVNEQIKEKEAGKLSNYIKEDAYVIALAIEGKEYSSEAFAEKIDKLGIMGKSHIIFIIGGSLGIHDKLLDRADEKISFSKMTFPHQMMRMILLEQIYRAYRICNGEPYHK